MATDEERMVITLEARTAALERQMKKGVNAVNRSSRTMERRVASMSKRMNDSFASAGKRVATIFAGVAAARGAQQLVDSATSITNALKVAGVEGDNLRTVYDALFKSAQANATPLEALVTLYSRASQSAADLGASQEDLLKFTDNIAMALRASGQSATESAGALLQLSQALGDGKVQAEEYNSLLDGGRTILQAVAAGMDKAGGKVSALTRLVKAGKVSSKAFFDAFQAGAPILQEKLASSEMTVSQHLVRLQNVLIDAAGKFNKSSKASETLGTALDNLSTYIENVNFDHLITGLSDFLTQVDKGIAKIDNLANHIGHLTGLDKIGALVEGHRPDGLLGGYSTAAVQDRVEGAFAGGSPGGGGALTPEAIRAAAEGVSAPTVVTVHPKPAAVKPITLANYPVGGSSSKKRGGGGSTNSLQSEIRQIQDRTKALQAMTQAQASINPLVEDYGFAVDKARAKQDLLNAAQKAGVKITPELEDKINALATGFGNATAAAEKLHESQDKIRQSAEAFADAEKDVLGGFITDLTHGKSAADALADALSNIGDKLLNVGLNALFNPKAGGGGALLGSLFIIDIRSAA